MRESDDVSRIWMRQASYDLESARFMMREGFYSQVCFMAEQVAEKTLKALAFHRGDSDVRGHSLKALVSSLECPIPNFQNSMK